MEHLLTSEKTFRYYVEGDIHTATKLVYVLHGYGQLAQYFIRKFLPTNKNIVIVAPEGMHRFYLKGSSGRVGASWMTKEDRENDIKDNINWLNNLHQKLLANKSFEKVIVLGFSQGGATAARWVNQMEKVDGLIMWATVFPPDLENSIDSTVLRLKNHFVLGTEDEYFDINDQQKVNQFYAEMNFDIHSFIGEHDINHKIFSDIINCL